MSHQLATLQPQVPQLIQATVRIRSDQKRRLEQECRAKGVGIADALRDNLDLAFAMKAELARIAEGEYDENDPKNTPRLVHSLLFRVEERILTAFEDLSKRIDLSQNEKGSLGVSKELLREYSPQQITKAFVALIADDSKYDTTVWLGAFLEIVSRLHLVTQVQLDELERKGSDWLEEISSRESLL